MKKQTSSVNLTGKDIEVVLEALKELRGQMPFLVALSPQQRRQTPRVGLPHLATAENCLMAAREYPTLLPANFDLEQFADSVRVMVGLHKCWTALKELTSDVGDTLSRSDCRSSGSSCRSSGSNWRSSGSNCGLALNWPK